MTGKLTGKAIRNIATSYSIDAVFKVKIHTLIFLFFATTFCTKPSIKPDIEILNPDIPSTGIAASPIIAPGPAIPVGLLEKTPTENERQLLAKPLTSSGQNSEAQFSPDGSRIIFVSRDRSTHKQAQIYEMHLGKMTEKRITYHDGDDAGPTYLPDGLKFLFASTTDEIKEEPYAVERLMKTYTADAFEKRTQAKPFRNMMIEGFEIYQQTLNSRNIERVTQSPGFDSEADQDRKSKRLVFSSSRRSTGTHIFLMQSKGMASPITEGTVIDRSPRFSPDGKSLVWSRQSKEQPDRAHLVLAIVGNGNFRKQNNIFEPLNLNLHPSWNPGGSEIIFSSNRDGKFLNLYTTNLSGNCIQRLTNAEFDQTHPVFSPDGKKVLFTGTRKGEKNIYLMDFVASAKCLKSVDNSANSSPISGQKSGPETK